MKETLFERIGGKDTVDAMVVTFYEYVFADSELNSFFKETNVDKLINMQREFFTAALGGPIVYTGKPIHEAHFGLGISRKQFARFVNHLLKTLESYDLSAMEVSDIIAQVSTYLPDVTGVSGDSA